MAGLFSILLLASLVAVCTVLAEKVAIPDPVLITIVGIGISFIPAFPTINLDPEFVLLGLLPPLVYSAAVKLPWEEFRANLRPISFLAVGLVLVTTAAVGVVAHTLISRLSWGEAFALGAIVSPTDPVAASAVTERLGAPRRLVAIIEGEGLVNDAVALTLLRLATAAVLSRSFSATGALGRFALIVIGETAYGVLIGWLAATIRRRIDDARIEITISLLTPFGAYLVPQALGGSGVLAALAAGMYIGARSPELIPSGIRLHLTGVWDMLIYLLNGILFLLTGFEFRSVVTGTRGFSGPQLLMYGAAIALIAISIRFAWTWPAAWATGKLSKGGVDAPLPNRQLLFLASCGMRGGISLAAALSLSRRIPHRDLMVFITACVIAATLILQGGPLPFFLRLLKLDEDARKEGRQGMRLEVRARAAALMAALKELEKNGSASDRLRGEYEHRLELLKHGDMDGETGSGGDHDQQVRMQLDAIAAERRTVIALHRERKLPEYVLHRIERDLDLREVRLRQFLSTGNS